MPGHPDGQSYALWRGNALLSAQETVTNIAPFALDAIVTNFASLMVHVQAAANNGGAVTSQFYDDAAHTKFAGQFSWQLWNCDLQATIPILGNYLHFTITTANAGNQVFTCYIAPFNVGVGAGATFTAQLPDIVAGLVYVSGFPADTSGKLQLEVDDLSAAGSGIAAIIPVQTFTVPFLMSTACGERVLALKIVNTDGAAAHSISYHVRTLSQ